MSRKDFIPGPDAEFSEWLRALIAAVHEHATTLNISPDELAALDQAFADFEDKLRNANEADAAAKAATNLKQTSRRAAEKVLRTFLRRLKTNPGYTEAFGARLNILMPQTASAPDSFRPILTVTALLHGIVEVAWVKGRADSINIYCQRDGDPGWVLLGRDTLSPYRDERPLLVPEKPETRNYRARYVIADEEVGDVSDISVAIAHP